jgi:ornithine carbamoyltransferase
VRLCAPKVLWPAEPVVAKARSFAAATSARIALSDDPKAAVAGCDFVYTDVWVSLGEPPAKWGERIALLKPYQVNGALMAATGNKSAKFMHCLPAFHNRETAKGEELFKTYGMSGLEVTDEVFESERSIVFDQAENRMHTIKALLVATLS